MFATCKSALNQAVAACTSWSVCLLCFRLRKKVVTLVKKWMILTQPICSTMSLLFTFMWVHNIVYYFAVIWREWANIQTVNWIPYKQINLVGWRYTIIIIYNNYYYKLHVKLCVLSLLLLFLQLRQYNKALSILERLFKIVEPLGKDLIKYRF